MVLILGPLCTGSDPAYRLDCKNGGVCLEDSIGNSTYCQCTSEYEGPLCEQNVTIVCDPNVCENNGTCSVTDNGVECTCKPGTVHCFVLFFVFVNNFFIPKLQVGDLCEVFKLKPVFNDISFT